MKKSYQIIWILAKSHFIFREGWRTNKSNPKFFMNTNDVQSDVITIGFAIPLKDRGSQMLPSNVGH
jgi:hypothetical protein